MARSGRQQHNHPLPQGIRNSPATILDHLAHRSPLKLKNCEKPTVRPSNPSYRDRLLERRRDVSPSSVPVHLPHNTGYVLDITYFFGMAAEAFKTVCLKHSSDEGENKSRLNKSVNVFDFRTINVDP